MSFVTSLSAPGEEVCATKEGQFVVLKYSSGLSFSPGERDDILIKEEWWCIINNMIITVQI